MPNNHTTEFNFQKMTQKEAEEIANLWTYDGIYAFYNVSADEEDYRAFIDAGKRGNSHFSCYSDKGLTAYYSVEITDGSTAEIGLGIKPQLCGMGLGVSYLNAVMEHITSMNGVYNFTLSVALFNRRAIKAYKTAGFEEAGTFMQDTNGGSYEFLRMAKYTFDDLDTSLPTPR